MSKWKKIVEIKQNEISEKKYEKLKKQKHTNAN